MKRLTISLLLLFFSEAFFAGLFIQPGAAQPRQPNIILILTDDQGYGDVGRHGNPILKTPNLDRLHDESVRFTDFHVSPTCAPTRSALLSGRHEFKNGVTHTILERERMSLKTVTLAEVLKTAGYATGIFGKWHLGDEPERWPSRRGFDEMFIHGCGGIGQTYPGTCGDAPGNQYFDPVINHNGKFEKTSGYCTDVFFGQAMRWVRTGRGRKPFFAMITPNAPHSPLVVAEKYEKMYADKLPADKAGTDTAKFFGMIANIDENVGKLLALLEETSLERDTLLIFMNDNGGTAGARVWNAGMRGQKNTPYLGGTRAISFWRWPGEFKPAAVDRLTGHIDVFPTLVELAGAKLSSAAQAQVEGRSLAPLLRNPQADWPDRHLFTHIGRWAKGADPNNSKYAQCAVRSTRWRLVNSSREGVKRWELYDVKADPGEKNDIAAEHPDVVKAMDAAYDKWWAEVLPKLENENAPQPAVNPYRQLYWKQYRGPGPNNAPETKPANQRSSQSQTRPNILVLYADDWRHDTLGLAGNPVVKTPHLDRLARDGVWFRRAYVTTSICGVSRASLFTGQWMSRHGNTAFNAFDTPWAETYPGLLRARGYWVGHIGKWHNGKFPAEQFDFGRSYSGVHYLKQPDGTSIHVTQKNENDALEFLRARPADRPFCLTLAFFATHAEDQNPKQYLYQPQSESLYRDVTIPVPKTAGDEYFKRLPPFIANEKNEGRNRWHWRFDTPEKYQHYMKAYYRLATEVDAAVGRVLAELKAQGLDENTLVIFTTDNGYFHGERGLADKWYPYEESIRVPLIVRDPRLKANQRGAANDDIVLNTDLAPTMLAFAGVAAPARMQGRDFAPLYLAARKPAWRDEFFYEHATIRNTDFIPSSEALVRKEIKYIRWPDFDYEELFDLRRDPLETRNLAADPGHRASLVKLRRRFAELRAQAR